MKAKFVFEFYDRNDPNIYKKIGIGKKTWDKLQPGDFLKPKKEVKVGRDDHFKPPSYKTGTSFYEEDYVVVYSFKVAPVIPNRRSFYQGGYHIGLHRAWDLEEALKVRKTIEAGAYVVDTGFFGKRPVEGTIKQWQERFDISQE